LRLSAHSRTSSNSIVAGSVGDRKAQKSPLCVVATAGTVNTGAIDPVDDLAEVCARENLWLHVDGAYGALFALSERVKSSLSPCGRADSIALDPHKLLFAPLEAGCLIDRDRQTLRKAFHFASCYLTVEEDPLLTNYLEYGPHLSRGFNAFKIWCARQVFGVGAFRAAYGGMLGLAQYMALRITAEPASSPRRTVTHAAAILHPA
jgi:aromatic-L-amino-acid decarboxylase